MNFRVLSVNFEYGIHSEQEEEGYCFGEYGEYFYCYSIEKRHLINKANELYKGNWQKEEEDNSNFWVEIVQAVIDDTREGLSDEEAFDILRCVPDIEEASFLTQRLYDRVVESETNMAYIEFDEKEDLEEEAGKPWDILEKEVLEDIRKFHLDDVIEVNYETLVTGYGDLQTRFKESKKRWGKKWGFSMDINRICI